MAEEDQEALVSEEDREALESEEDEESLELDKLDASPGENTDSADSPESADEEGETEKPSKKTPVFIHRLLVFFKDKGFIFSLVAGLLLAGIAYYFFFVRTSETLHTESGFQGQITYSVSAPIGFKYSIAFKLLVPFKDMDEKRVLTEKLSNIRPSLMALSQNPDIAKSLREKDTEAIKAEIMTIANRFTGIPFTELELTGLTIE